MGIQLQLLVGMGGTDDVVRARQAAPVGLVPAHARAGLPTALELSVVVLGLVGRREHATNSGAGSFRVLYQEEDLHCALRGSARGTGRCRLVPLGVVLVGAGCRQTISRGRPRRSRRPRPRPSWRRAWRPDGGDGGRPAWRRAPQPPPPPRRPARPSPWRRCWHPGDGG